MEENIVLDLIKEAISSDETLFVVDVKFLKNNVVKIVVDGDNGIKLSECVRISRHIENNLDREENDFSLEVGSPNIADPLKNVRQYKKNLGRILKVKTESDKIEGTLIALNSDSIELEWKVREPKPIGKGKVTVTKNAIIAFEDIKQAKVKILF